MFKLFSNTHLSNNKKLEQHVLEQKQIKCKNLHIMMSCSFKHSIALNKPHTHQIKIMLMQVLKAHDTYLLEFPYVTTHSLLFSLILLLLYLSLIYIW